MITPFHVSWKKLGPIITHTHVPVHKWQIHLTQHEIRRSRPLFVFDTHSHRRPEPNFLLQTPRSSTVQKHDTANIYFLTAGDSEVVKKSGFPDETSAADTCFLCVSRRREACTSNKYWCVVTCSVQKCLFLQERGIFWDGVLAGGEQRVK